MNRSFSGSLKRVGRGTRAELVASWPFSVCAANLAIAVVLAAPDDARAQSAPVFPEPALEDVVVTARKRDERLQDTPISISAFTAAQIDQRGLTDVSQVAQTAPGIHFEAQSGIAGNSNSSSIYIRGIGQNDFIPTLEPGVGTYLDGVYIARSIGGTLDLVDVERVEILRGPQGTLFGRNTIGGAVSLTSKPPAEVLGGYVEATVGSYDRQDYRASVEGPIGDRIEAKLTGGYFSRDGDVTRIVDGRDLGNTNKFVGRADIAFQPTDEWDLRLAVDGTSSSDHGPGSELVALNPNGLAVVDYNTFFGGTPGSPSYYDARFLSRPYKTYDGGPSHDTLNLWGVSFTATRTFGDFDLKSITAYRQFRSEFGLDTDVSPLPVSLTLDNDTGKQFSQELQFNGKFFDDRLKLTTGLYYFRELASDTGYVPYSTFSFSTGGKVRNSSYAVFGQGTYQVTDALEFTAGLRYTIERKGYNPQSNILRATPGSILGDPALGFAEPGIFVGQSILPPGFTFHDFYNVSPVGQLAYHWEKDLMTYVSVSQGFKSGGFTQRALYPLPTVPTFGPEKATVYEVGVKTELFDKRLRINADGFYTDYDNVQIVGLSNGAPIYQNAGSATIKGVEAELSVVPVVGLDLSVSLAYTDAAYNQLAAGVVANGVNLGSKFPFTSKWTGSLSASYTFDVGTIATVTPEIDWSYRSTYYLDYVNSPELRQGGYGFGNITANVRPIGYPWELNVGINNFTDRRYKLNGYADQFVDGSSNAYFSRPLEVFARLRWKFI